jgi:hypothetical protein
MIHVLVVIWSGWRDDLVESCRRLRGPILAAAALYAVAVIAVQISEVFWGSAHALSPLAAAVLFALSLAGIGALLQADPELFAPMAGSPSMMPLPESARAISGDDVRVTQKLDRLMRVERAYRGEALTISALALKPASPNTNCAACSTNSSVIATSAPISISGDSPMPNKL